MQVLQLILKADLSTYRDVTAEEAQKFFCVVNKELEKIGLKTTHISTELGLRS